MISDSAVKKVVMVRKQPSKSMSAHVERKKKRKRGETFGIYIYKVLRQVQPEIGLSKKSMAIMNSLINDIFDRIAMEAIRLAQYNKKRTLSAAEIQTSVRLQFPGELGNHAMNEGRKAVEKYKEVIC